MNEPRLDIDQLITDDVLDAGDGETATVDILRATLPLVFDRMVEVWPQNASTMGLANYHLQCRLDAERRAFLAERRAQELETAEALRARLPELWSLAAGRAGNVRAALRTVLEEVQR